MSAPIREAEIAELKAEFDELGDISSCCGGNVCGMICWDCKDPCDIMEFDEWLDNQK